LYVLLEAPFEGEHVFSSIRRVYEKKKREFFSLSPNDMQKIDPNRPRLVLHEMRCYCTSRVHLPHHRGWWFPQGFRFGNKKEK